jgi:hypothetical protein
MQLGKSSKITLEMFLCMDWSEIRTSNYTVKKRLAILIIASPGEFG